VPTYGIVLDHSRIGLAAFADEETNRRIMAFQRGNPSHIEDALIASTAEHLGASLVTEERRRKAYRDHFPRLSVLSVRDLRS
jgi:predicted nucleic acid-binding protein